MTTNELFEIVIADTDFLKQHSENSVKVLKHRHNTGKLSQRTYNRIFNNFGYKKQPDQWIKNNENSN